jgi:hypothetical protein
MGAIDMSNFYIHNDLKEYQYMKFHISMIPQEIIDECNLQDIGGFRVQVSFFECVRYLATRKILEKLLRIESHHHDNGNVSNRTSMGIDLFNTNLLDEILILVRLIGTKSSSEFW